jgi:hypothetical protein
MLLGVIFLWPIQKNNVHKVHCCLFFISYDTQQVPIKYHWKNKIK